MRLESLHEHIIGDLLLPLVTLLLSAICWWMESVSCWRQNKLRDCIKLRGVRKSSYECWANQVYDGAMNDRTHSASVTPVLRIMVHDVLLHFNGMCFTRLLTAHDLWKEFLFRSIHIIKFESAWSQIPVFPLTGNHQRSIWHQRGADELCRPGVLHPVPGRRPYYLAVTWPESKYCLRAEGDRPSKNSRQT